MLNKRLTRREFIGSTSMGYAAARLASAGARGSGPSPGAVFSPEAAATLAGLPRPGIIPAPQQLELRGAPFFLDESCVVALPHGASAADTSLARFLTQELSDHYDLQLRTVTTETLLAGKKAIIL